MTLTGGLLKLLQTFWGLAVIAGLGGYSLYEVLTADRAAPRPALAMSAAPTGTPEPPRPTPIGGYPTPAPMNIFLTCDGPDGAAVPQYLSSPGGFAVLRVDVDRELIIEVMAGTSTRFPANANLVQSPCMRSLLRSGAFP